jgi:hypothetical protein
MIKVIYCSSPVYIYISFTAINVATCTLTRGSSSSISANSRYMQYLRERSQMERLRSQFEELCPGKDDELDDALAQLKECADEVDQNTETACSAIKNHFLRCSKPFLELLENCVPEKSKEVPKLVFHAVNSGISYLCKTDGEHIFELANMCVFKTDYRMMRCERRIKSKLQQFQKNSPTKTDICEMANSYKPCLYNHLQSSCGNRITREAFTGLFDAMTSPCKTVQDNGFERNDINEVELLE